MNFTKHGTNGDANMGAIRYAFKDGRFVLADGCNITEADGVEELDCSVRLYKLLQQNGYDTIGQVTAKPGMTFFNMNCMSLVVLRELLERLDFLGFRLADWNDRQTVDEYFTIFQAAEEKRRSRIRAQIAAESRYEAIEKMLCNAIRYKEKLLRLLSVTS